jgi:Tol biopolymer transport system component
VATVTNTKSSLWSVDLAAPAGPSKPVRVSSGSAAGVSPRAGPGYLLYQSWRGDKHGIWKLENGATRELWSETHSDIIGAPAISPDGRRVAFTVGSSDKTLLYVMGTDGAHARIVADSLTLRGSPAWTPDGQSVTSAVLREGEPRLTTISLNGNPPLPLVSEYSIDPVWSPDGQFLIYSGADVGTTFPLRAVARDGRPYQLPTLILTRGARHVVFWRDGRAIVVLRGEIGRKNFWLVDLHTGAERQLTDFASDIVIRDFDLSPDGKEILFDRIEDNSEIALIERSR